MGCGGWVWHSSLLVLGGVVGVGNALHAFIWEWLGVALLSGSWIELPRVGWAWHSSSWAMVGGVGAGTGTALVGNGWLWLGVALLSESGLGRAWHSSP